MQFPLALNTPAADFLALTTASQTFPTIVNMTPGQYFIFCASVACWIRQGTTPTASAAAGSSFVPANTPAYISGQFGAKLAVITDTSEPSPPGDPVETQVPATASAVTILTGQGMLLTATVTAVGSTTLTFQDGAGNIIGEVLSTATVGQQIVFNMPFGTSLVANKSTTTPVVTVAYQQLPAAGRASLTPVLF